MYAGPKREHRPATLSRSSASSSEGTSGRIAMWGTLRDVQPVFDGHNDALLRAGAEAIATGRPDGHLDVPRARAGGLAGGIFAVFTPGEEPELVEREDGWESPLPPALAPGAAAEYALRAAGRLFRLQALGALRVVP